MAIKTYSLKRDGNTKLSEHFTVREFACSDGSDQIKIDPKLVDYLEKIRAHFGKPVCITSGYRSPAHNEKVGGVKSSYHVKGMAADIVIDGVKSRDVAEYAETIGCGGIGWYEARNFTHIDTRSGRVRWKDSGNNVVKTFQTSASGSAVAQAPAPAIAKCPYAEPAKTIQFGAKGNNVKWLQWHLNQAAGCQLTIDGDFGIYTKIALLKFQKSSKLVPDGIVGAKTRTALKKAVK